MAAESKEAGGTGVGIKIPMLKKYGIDLTKLAKEDKLDPLVGRDADVERVIQILCRRMKNNPCLIGHPGVGKTAIAEGLAQRIVKGDVPETLEGKKVISLDMGLLVSGTIKRGMFEERLTKVMEEIKRSGQIILFIDEVHILTDPGSTAPSISVANVLKPVLARGELKCIGATTLDEYKKYIERDPALERRFQPVKLLEPTVDETILILRGLQERYEIHHKVHYTDRALVAAAQLSHQYISERFLPDKAIDLIDEAGSRVQIRRLAQLRKEGKELNKMLGQITEETDGVVRGQDFEKDDEGRNKVKSQTEKSDLMVTEIDIQDIVFSWTGIPVKKALVDSSSRLLKMEDTLHRHIIGQDEAIDAVCRAIRRARAGLKDPNRPIASFIFLGPTGVGKSGLAKALAATYFEAEKAMIQLDMSEYMERHTVSKLIGSPVGYIGSEHGGQLTEPVRRRPHSIVLFDEIEKAHHDVFNIMLQILEDGRLTDGNGRTADFKNTLVILTSNIGSKIIENGSGQNGELEDDSYEKIKNLVKVELKSHFQPELLNRIDETIIFRQLTKLQAKEIAGLMVNEVFKRLNTRAIKLCATERFIDRVVEEGYSPSYGARSLRRALTKLLEDTLAYKMLSGEINEGDSMTVDVNSNGKVVFVRCVDGNACDKVSIDSEVQGNRSSNGSIEPVGHSNRDCSKIQGNGSSSNGSVEPVGCSGNCSNHGGSEVQGNKSSNGSIEPVGHSNCGCGKDQGNGSSSGSDEPVGCSGNCSNPGGSEVQGNRSSNGYIEPVGHCGKVQGNASSNGFDEPVGCLGSCSYLGGSNVLGNRSSNGSIDPVGHCGKVQGNGSSNGSDEPVGCLGNSSNHGGSKVHGNRSCNGSIEPVGQLNRYCVKVQGNGSSNASDEPVGCSGNGGNHGGSNGSINPVGHSSHGNRSSNGSINPVEHSSHVCSKVQGNGSSNGSDKPVGHLGNCNTWGWANKFIKMKPKRKGQS